MYSSHMCQASHLNKSKMIKNSSPIKLVVFAFCLVVLVCLSVVSASTIKLHPEHRLYTDEFGRERYFHGLNVVYKSHPFVAPYEGFDSEVSFSEEDMAYFEEWGLNVIRLGLIWAGAEPEQGKYNDTYFAAVKDMVEKSAEHGIYTVLDAHQDALSEIYCGEGAPGWAVEVDEMKDFPFPFKLSGYERHEATKRPSQKDCLSRPWPMYQATQAAAKGFQRMYDSEKTTNGTGTREAFARFWGRAAVEFKDSDSVIGYELFNEPFAGDIYSDIALLQPSKADSVNLLPFYAEAVKEIRKIDNATLVMFEPVTWSEEEALNWMDEWSTGFDDVPGGTGEAHRSVLAYHYYKWIDIGSKRTYFRDRKKAGDKLKVGLMVTEFETGSLTSLSYMDDTLNAYDDYRLSWIGWEYKVFAGAVEGGTCTGCERGVWNKDGTLNTATVSVLSRTYAQAIAGHAVDIKYSHKTKHYSLTFEATIFDKRAPTDIYLNEAMHYPSGFSCVTSALGATCVHVGRNHVHVVMDDSIQMNQHVTVTIVPTGGLKAGRSVAIDI